MPKRYPEPPRVTAEERAQAQHVSLRRIARLFTEHRGALAIVTVIIVASSVIAMAQPFLLREVIDVALPQRRTSGSWSGSWSGWSRSLR